MSFDVATAHRAFSAEFFNLTWELLEKSDRTKEDEERMISLAHASMAHWRLRDDCAPRNLSIGFWQISRVYAVLGQADNAAHYGRLCLDVSSGEPAFFVGYAHEALARAAKLAGDRVLLEQHLAAARESAAQVPDAEERAMLEKDLEELSAALSA